MADAEGTAGAATFADAVASSERVLNCTAGEHDMFLCGNDDTAKDEARRMLADFGWRSVIDLGDITNARGTEQLLPLWIRLWGHVGHPHFNFRIQKGAAPETA